MLLNLFFKLSRFRFRILQNDAQIFPKQILNVLFFQAFKVAKWPNNFISGKQFVCVCARACVQQCVCMCLHKCIKIRNNNLHVCSTVLKDKYWENIIRILDCHFFLSFSMHFIFYLYVFFFSFSSIFFNSNKFKYFLLYYLGFFGAKNKDVKQQK